MENNKCPYCRNELQEGLVQSGKLVFFAPKIHKLLAVPNLSKENEVVLTSNNMTYPNCVAFLCNDCKKVIIDYTNTKQEI